MKKVIISLIFMLFLIPTVVFAEEKVEIKSITFLEKSENTKINTEASTDGEKINLDLTFYDKNDYAAYNVVIKNPNDVGLYINDKYFNYDKEYISYDFDSNYLEAGEEKTITLKVSYKKEVPKSNFISGKYDASINDPVILSDRVIQIPNTLKNLGILGLSILIITAFCLLIGFYTIFKNKKFAGVNILIIGLLLILVPSKVSALLRIELPIDSNILIKMVKDNPCIYDGEMTVGAEYVNGQYTYKYMKEYDNGWVNITTDGWGVKLSNLESTDEVNTKLCTSINNKPIVSMSDMFRESKASKIDLSSFDTSNVINMKRMFQSLVNATELDMSTFDFSNVTNASYFVAYSMKLSKLEIKNADFGKVTTLKEAFYDLGYRSESDVVFTFENINAPLVTDFDHGFSYIGVNAPSVKFSVKNVDIQKVSTANDLFLHIGESSANVDFVIDNLDISAATGMYQMFYHVADKSNGDVKISINNVKLPNATTAEYAFGYVGSSANSVSLELSNLDASGVTNAYGMFHYTFKNAKKVDVKLKNVDLSKATNMMSFFYTSCNKSNTCSISFDNVDTSSVTNMSYFFNWAGERGTSFIVKGFDKLNTKNVTSMNGLFYSATQDNAEGYKELGTVNVYASDIGSLFSNAKNAKAVVNIYKKPTSFNYAFERAATTPGSQIVVNYTSEVDNIDDIIATKTEDSNVIKGNLIED